MEYPISLVIAIICVSLAEIGGIGFIKQTRRSPNATFYRRIGLLVCISSIFGFILIAIGIWLDVFP